MNLETKTLSLISLSEQSLVDTNGLEFKLGEIDKSIKTWIRVAIREKIDVSTEIESLKCIRSKPQKGKDVKIFNLLLIKYSKERIFKCISKKIVGKIHRRPQKQMLLSLTKEFGNLTNNFYLPWLKNAREALVDISEEATIINSAKKNSQEQLLEKHLNHSHISEIILRRLIFLNKQCTLKIIHKVYSKRIVELARASKERCLLDDAQVIEGIANDALNALPKSLDLAYIEMSCEKIFNIFTFNINLLIHNPKEYHRLADREWLRREILKRTEDFLIKAKNSFEVNRILNFRDMAFQLLLSDEKTERIAKKLINLLNCCLKI